MAPVISSHLDDDEPTRVPGPVIDDDDDVSVDLAVHIRLDKNEVKEAVRASKVISVPEIPRDIAEEAAKSPPPIPPEVSGVKLDEDKGAIPTSESPPIEVFSQQLGREPGKVRPATPPAIPLPATIPTVSKPIEPSSTAPKKSSGASMFFLLLLLAAVVGGGAWFLMNGEPEEVGRSSALPSGSLELPPHVPTSSAGANEGRELQGSGAPSHEPEQVVAKGVDLPVAKVVEADSAGVEVRAQSGGAVAWIVADGIELAAGEPVVKFRGYKNPENTVRRVSERLEYYQGAVVKAIENKNDAAKAAAERKVEEKKGLVVAAEEKLSSLVVKTPVAGPVRVLVPMGANVAAGTSVARVGGGRSVRGATFAAGTSASQYKPSAPCVVANRASRDQEFSCVVDSVEGGRVSVRLLEGAPVKAGAEVVLLPPRPR